MSTVANDLFALVMKDLDDENAIRSTTPDLFLRHVNRAQQWVALRYQLLREVFAFPLYQHVPIYALVTVHPRLVVITHMTHVSDGTPLARVAMTSLRYKDTAWFVTEGSSAFFYRLGWRYIGVYPVPSNNATATVTGLLLPATVTSMISRLQIPDSYVPHVSLVTAGLLMVARERRYGEGIARIRQGLGIAQAPQSPAPSAGTQEAASVAN